MVRLTRIGFLALTACTTAYALDRDEAIKRATEALHARIGDKAIVVKQAVSREWRNASLGCPQPGMMYAQVIMQGYQVILIVDGKEYDWRVHDNGARLCEPSKSKRQETSPKERQ